MASHEDDANQESGNRVASLVTGDRPAQPDELLLQFHLAANVLTNEFSDSGDIVASQKAFRDQKSHLRGQEQHQIFARLQNLVDV